jgi:D-aspartate ligase
VSEVGGPPVAIVRGEPGVLPGLGVARTLGRLGVPIALLYTHADAAAARSRYVSIRSVWDPFADPSAAVETLRRTVAPLGADPVLIPTDDTMAVWTDRYATELRAAGFRFAEQPRGLVERLVSKSAMREVATELEIATPAVDTPADWDEAFELAERVDLPVVVKKREPEPGSSTASVEIYQDRASLRRALEERAGADGCNVLFQAFIPGGSSSVWMCNAYFDATSSFRFGATGRKIRQWRPDTGWTTLGVCEPNPDVQELTERLAKGTGYRGVIDIGFRFDERDGRYLLLDVNPRVGATFRLFAAPDGTDVVRAMYRDLAGDEPTSATVRAGRRWMVETHDLASSVAHLRDGSLSLGGWASSLRGVEELAVFAADDPRPFVASVASLARRRRSRPEGDRSEQVRAMFDARRGWWDDSYRGGSQRDRVYQARLQRAMDLLPPGPGRALDLGTGAGHGAIALARTGFEVHALDAAPQMVATAIERAKEAGVGVRFLVGEAERLPFDDATFDVVSALGLLPWVDAPAALAEIGRVLRPGGRAVVTADNRWGLIRLFDPWRNPFVHLPNGGKQGRRARMHTRADVRRMIATTTLQVESWSTLGYAPITFHFRPVLRDARGTRAHERLQRLSDHGTPVVANLGAHHVVELRRPD